MAAQQSDLPKLPIPSTDEVVSPQDQLNNTPNPNGVIPSTSILNASSAEVKEIKEISEAVRAKAERLYNFLRMGLPDLYQEIDSEMEKTKKILNEVGSAMHIILDKLRTIKSGRGKEDDTVEDEYIKTLEEQHKLMGEQILALKQMRNLKSQRRAKKDSILKIFEEIIQQLDKDNMLENLKPDLQQDPLRRKIFRMYQMNYHKLPPELQPKSSVQLDNSDSWTLPQFNQIARQPRMRGDRAELALFELFRAQAQGRIPAGTRGKVKIDDKTILKFCNFGNHKP